MSLVDSSIDDPDLHPCTSVTLAAYCGPESWSADQCWGSIHFQVVEIVARDKSRSRGVQKTMHVVPIQLDSNSVQDDRVFIDNLNGRHVVFQPSLRRRVTIRQV